MYNEIDLLRLDQIVICSYCDSSTVCRTNITTTIASINEFDSSNGHHEHDSNIITASYKCNNGHSFAIKPLNSCWCGWRQ